MDDLISRQAAIEVVEQLRYHIWLVDIPSPGNVPAYIEHHKQMQALLEYCAKLRDTVETMPSAQPTADVVERKDGKWEFIGGYGYQYRCSACIMCAEHKTNFCPNCGADMRTEPKDES